MRKVKWEEKREKGRDQLSNMFFDYPQDKIQQARYYIKVKLFRY